MTGPIPPTVDGETRAAVVQRLVHLVTSAALQDLDYSKPGWLEALIQRIASGPIASALAARERERDEARAEVESAIRVCDSYAEENQRFHDRFTAAEAELTRVTTEGVQKTARVWVSRALAAEAEIATLRASAERMEADHAEEIARLREALEPFAKANAIDPPDSWRLTDWLPAVTGARTALTPKEPDHG